MIQERSIGTSCSLRGLQGPLSINTSVIPHPALTWGQAAAVAMCFLTPEQLKQQDKVPKTKPHFQSTRFASPPHV